jgi:NAD(P)-dependent dehydrogenase (short-subunit alcohol dehydrogenase family)
MTSFSRAADRLLDASLLGYTRLGYSVRERSWAPLPRMDGRVVVVTGASSGIGRAAASRFAELGASVIDVVRDAPRARPEAADVRVCDVSSLADVRRFAEDLTRVDVLVNNAGALPAERSETGEGIEVAFATNVLGPFLLTSLLRPARVITVTSGGMYTARLDAFDLQTVSRPYRGAEVYARTKRAEVVLTSMWAERGVSAHAMHPGWVDTAGLASSLPGFHRALKPLLRTPSQGADTIVWLGSADVPAGRLWHDRAERPAYRLPWTREAPADRERLWAELERQVRGDREHG